MYMNYSVQYVNMYQSKGLAMHPVGSWHRCMVSSKIMMHHTCVFLELKEGWITVGNK